MARIQPRVDQPQECLDCVKNELYQMASKLYHEHVKAKVAIHDVINLPCLDLLCHIIDNNIRDIFDCKYIDEP